MIQDILQIGNKIDICALEKENRKKNDGKKTPILVSQLEGVDDDGELVIRMPMYKGKLVLLSLGSRYELMFYARRGLYRAVCQVTDRYKEDNLFMVKVVLKSNLAKYQRREYFRLECIIGMEAYELTRDDAMMLAGQRLEQRVKDPEIAQTETKAVIVDISGGGIRFISEHRHEEGDCLAVHMTLSNANVEKDIWVVVSIISCRKAAQNMERYETRAEYVHLGSKLRETIIKYIFDEDRKIRKKDMGV